VEDAEPEPFFRVKGKLGLFDVNVVWPPINVFGTAHHFGARHSKREWWFFLVQKGGSTIKLEYIMGKKIDVASLEVIVGTLYPPPFDEPCVSRERIKLGDAAGLTQYGVNLMRLPPGAWSSQRGLSR
jgi:hypothetical protein